MAVTRLKRKGLRNKARAKQRKEDIKDLTRMPPIQNVDVDAIKEEFAQKSGKPATKKEKKEENSTAQEKDPPSSSSDKKTDEAPIVEESVTDVDATAELKEPAKGSVEDAEMMEEVVEDAEQEEKPEVAPDVVSPEAGAPDETPSEADDTEEDK